MVKVILYCFGVFYVLLGIFIIIRLWHTRGLSCAVVIKPADAGRQEKEKVTEQVSGFVVASNK